MRKILLVIIALVVSGGTARATEPEGQPTELQILQKRVAELEAALKAQTATPVPTVAPSYVSTLVHGQPTAYQCFLGDNPGLAPGLWVTIRNRDHHRYMYATVGDAPIIVMRPTANGMWEPLFPGRQDRTVLPPGRECTFHAPARLNGDGSLRRYVLRADLYDQAMGSMPGAVILEPYPSAHLNRPWEFYLNGVQDTVVSLEYFQFD